MTGQSAAAAGAPAPGSHPGPIPHSWGNLLGKVDYVLQPNIPTSILHTTAVCLVKGSADAVGALHVINPTTDALARAPRMPRPVAPVPYNRSHVLNVKLTFNAYLVNYFGR